MLVGNESNFWAKSITCSWLLLAGAVWHSPGLQSQKQCHQWNMTKQLRLAFSVGPCNEWRFPSEFRGLAKAACSAVGIRGCDSRWAQLISDSVSEHQDEQESTGLAWNMWHLFLKWARKKLCILAAPLDPSLFSWWDLNNERVVEPAVINVNLKWELTGRYWSLGDIQGIVDSELEWRVCGFLS